MEGITFTNSQFIILSIILGVLVALVLTLLIHLIRKSKLKNIKTPWFEIAPDSVNIPESEDMGKTRLLLKRQFEYVNNYIDGITSVFLALEKEIIDDAMNVLFNDKNVPKTHMRTCLINSNTNELIQLLKSYLNGVLVINHIGSDKDKIKRYAKSHVCQVVAIVKKHVCEIFSKLSGNICTDSTKYWNQIGINDPVGWAEGHLIEVLLGISELRYSDFDLTNDGDDK